MSKRPSTPIRPARTHCTRIHPARMVAASLIVALLAVPLPGASDATASDDDLYLVGAAVREIHPDAPGSPMVGEPVSGRRPVTEKIAARALVVEQDGVAAGLVMVDLFGLFAAYQHGWPGADEMRRRIETRTDGGLPADRVVVASTHTHSGPDPIFVGEADLGVYMEFLAEQVADAAAEAYATRRPATIVAGADAAPDLIYNMACSEALNQSPGSTFPNHACMPTQEGKDFWVRVLQARDAEDGEVIATAMAYAAHATLGGASGLHGDWPQFMADDFADRYGGVGLAFQGAVGRTQPCRPRCSFTDSSRPGFELSGRREAYTTMLFYHVERALLGAPAVRGPVAAEKAHIRHPVTNAALLALTYEGTIPRSLDPPWVVGNTILTAVTAIRIGTLLVATAPGEAYDAIAVGTREATNVPPQRQWTIGLADDQLGYLIAPVEGYPFIAALAPVNNNSILNVAPTLGDHVMCTQIRLARDVGFAWPPAAPDVEPVEGIGSRADSRCHALHAYDAALETAEGR